MIISTVNAESSEKKINDYSIFGHEFAEHGRGRKSLFIFGDFNLKRGENPDYSIEFTRNGKPKVVNKTGGNDFLILSSSGGYTRRGCGYVQVLKTCTEYKVLTKGNGADGDAGRIGTWDVVLLECPIYSNCIFRIKMSGGNPSLLCLKVNDRWGFYSLDDFRMLYNLNNQLLPFQVTEDDKFVKEDWQVI